MNSFGTIYRSYLHTHPSIRLEEKALMMTQDHNILKSTLQTRAADLARSMAERNQIAIERSADPMDETLLAAERESSARILTRDSRLLHELEAALARLRDGSYGVCLRCEEEIQPKRLKALPWASYCVSCQEKTEDPVALQPGLARAA
jgi:DnaK suppressor protein